MSENHPIALTIAGSDCSGGAGIQADLKTFQQYGVHGLSVITSIVAETPIEVRRIEPIEIPLLQDQLNILLETYPIKAIKTGLLPTRMSIFAIAEILNDLNIPMVIDPVMIASTGDSLLGEDTLVDLKSSFLPLASLITPNIPEASSLLKREIETADQLESAAQDIAETYQTACLLKGGHLPGSDDRVDVLWHAGCAHHFTHPYIDLPHGIHGTGCTLSSAIAAGLAKNVTMRQAVDDGIQYVQNMINQAHTWTYKNQTVRSLGW